MPGRAREETGLGPAADGVGSGQEDDPVANEEHLEVLKKGVGEWSRWRDENPVVRPDLTGAKLSGADLHGADLSRTDFRGADLSRTYLRGADLSHADLRGADLRDADLRGTDLSHADLSHADLRDACLIASDLTAVDLTDVRGAILGSTVIANVDLRRVEGLGTVTHFCPSTIGTNTLKRSRGQILPAFLRGCGLSDWEIENARLFNPGLDEDDLTTIQYEVNRIRGQQPFALSRVFLSYTRDDEPFVEWLERRFDEKGVRYWRDVHDLKAGRLDRQIDRAITMNPLVVVVLSKRSVHSPWVEWEVMKAGEIRRELAERGEEPRGVLCPVALDDAWKRCDWPAPLRRQIENHHILDFSGWEHDEEKMVRQFTKLYKGMVINYGKKDRE